MDDCKYKVCRDDIYIGRVVKTDMIYRLILTQKLYAISPSQVYYKSWIPCRSILFVPDSNAHSNDLLYNSPRYPILNVSDDDECLSLEGSNLVVQDATSLSELLKYYEYNEELGFDDILNIRKKFFSSGFAKENCELFGYREHSPEDDSYYFCDIKITNPKILELIVKHQNFMKKLGHKSFEHYQDGVLRSEYFNIINALGDNSFSDAIRGFYRRDSFVPHRIEGRILKLKKQ